MIFKNINSEDISGLIICSEPPISSSAIRTKETTIDGRDGAIVEKLGYKTRIRNVEIGLKKDANVDKILSYFSGEGDLIFKNENDKVYKAAIYEQVDLERLLRLRKGSVAFYCQPFKYKRNDIFETIKDNKVKEKKGEYLELLNCAEQNVVDLKLEGSTKQATRSGKNLLDNTATTKISNGITFTVNSDGTVLVDGTNDTSANSSFIINRYDLSPGTYILNGCPSGGASNTYRLVIQETGSYSILGSIDIGNGSGEFTIDTTTSVQIAIFIQKGLTINKLLFKPMLREATITDDTYEQYGASPSPDYPSPIENVEGKNKFNNNFSDYSKPVDYYICPIHVKNETSYKFNINLIRTKMTGCVIGIVKDGNQYSNFVGLSQALNTVGIVNNLSFKVDNTWVSPKLVIFVPNGETQFKQIFENYEVQLEEGTVATDYVPYNSLEIKDIGENLFNPSNAKDGYVTDNSGQILGVNIKNKNTNYIKIDCGEKYFILSNKLTGNWGSWYDKDKKFISGIALGGKNKGIVTAPNNAYFINFTVSYENNNPDYANNVMIARSDKEIPYKPYQEQKVDFPLSEGQKLMEGSYLANGIHHKRKQVVLDGSGDENWVIWKASLTNVERFYINLEKPAKQNGISLCSHFRLSSADSDTEHFRWSTLSGIQKQFVIFIDKSKATTVAELKTWLQSNPITVEYELLEEKIVPYTEAQQEAYNQLQKLKLYKGQNIIFSMEGTVINLKYLEDTDEKVENQGNIYSKPIIRLEKTVFKEVEIAINGIRFKYNFEEDDYVEIDCEEMTVQYEGLDRNRRLVIDFEFPKLKEGNNDIVMYSGDCIIKFKRKDRWL